MTTFQRIAIAITALSMALFPVGCGSATGTEGLRQSKADSEPVSASTVLETTWLEHSNGRMALHCRRLASTEIEGARGILLLPSATYSTLPVWDLAHGDSSTMEHFARAGWVVFALDLPGYGPSDDPADPAHSGAEQAEAYVHKAVQEIRNKGGVKDLSLIGWSWGAQVAGYYASKHPEQIDKLVLYGFTHRMRVPEVFLEPQPQRFIHPGAILADFVDGCFETDVAEAYANAIVASDSSAPRGALFDHVKRLPLVDPNKLPMPLLVISGQYEIELPPHMKPEYAQYFQDRRADIDAFCEAARVKLVEIGGGGHVVHLERPKDEWRLAVRQFLSGE